MSKKATAVGINHIALEVGNISEAIEFYGSFLSFHIESQSETAAFIYFGDQFINFSLGRNQPDDVDRHFGIAVDDKELVRSTLEALGVDIFPGRFLDFLDPWGNRVEITTYQNIQFRKHPDVLKGMGLEHVEKTSEAMEELRQRNLAPHDK